MRFRNAPWQQDPFFDGLIGTGFFPVDFPSRNGPIETLQIRFIKNLFHLPRNTPSYFLRQETNSQHISVQVIQRAITWWIKLLEMPEQRLPKICYRRLVKLDENQEGNRNNWASHMRLLTETLQMGELYRRQDPHAIAMAKLHEKYTAYKSSEDTLKIKNSTYSSFYHLIVTDNSYINFPLPTKHLRFIMQLRTSSDTKASALVDGISLKLNGETPCPVCHHNTEETLHHFTFICPAFDPLRQQFLYNYEEQHQQINILKPENTTALTLISSYFKQATLTRRQMLGI